MICYCLFFLYLIIIKNKPRFSLYKKKSRYHSLYKQIINLQSQIILTINRKQFES